VIFQPHRYTRTRDLADDFAQAFGDADTLQVLDIYAASEEPIPGVTAQILVEEIRKKGKEAEYMASFDKAAERASFLANRGDLVLTLGAGSVYQIGPMVIEELKKRVPNKESSRLA
jgi:UDP-N-acetylmuramate--alanine ligase